MVKRGFGRLASGSLVLAVAACNVSSAPPSTGGVRFDEVGPNCARGVAIVASDYQSTNIVVSKPDGTTLSESFISSGAAKPGLALALSGDVALPTTAPASKNLVIIDRYGTNVLTWMDLPSAKVLAQLPISTGFQSNPHDYMEVDATRAFVTRYENNPTPGVQPFDQGGDLLIVDTEEHAIAGRIAMPEEDAGLQPRPEFMTRLRGEIVVSLGRWSPNFSRAGDGRFVGVSPITNRVTWQLDIPGLQACGRLAVAPSGKLAAVACSSKMDFTTHKFDPKGSDIVVYDATVSPPRELRRFGLGKKLDTGLQPSLTFATDDAILALTYGGNGTAGDTAMLVSATTGAITTLVESAKPFVLGGMHCSPGCGDVCLLGDADRNRLRRWHVAADGRFEPLEDAVLETIIGLPPRSIGGL
ncbi:hypothetical protein [Pendulispora albinea]|uniref:Uncharacterized protein n=1 Tax=Pendulispora albinea TaxID=2741071 RepID=A0ABZ2M6R2_9BACT